MHAVDAREEFARGIRGIGRLRRVQAVIAIPTGRAVFAKVAQQLHTPALGGFRQGQQGVEFGAQHLLERIGRRAFVDHPALVHHVLQAVEHPGVGGLAIAAGAAGFLVVALDVLGAVQVGHKTHIGFVDAHAKGHGGHHDDAFFAQEAVLVRLTHRAIEAGVVGQGLEAASSTRTPPRTASSPRSPSSATR